MLQLYTKESLDLHFKLSDRILYKLNFKQQRIQNFNFSKLLWGRLHALIQVAGNQTLSRLLVFVLTDFLKPK